MKTIHKAYKFRIYPNKKQEILLNKTFGCVRFYWNHLVATFNSYDKEKNPEPHFSTPKELKEQFTFLGEVPYASLAQKERDFLAFRKQLFSKTRKSKIGFPKFKKKQNVQAFRLPNICFKLLDGRIQLSKIGKVKVVYDRVIPLTARLINVTVSRTTTNKYFVSVVVEEEVLPKTRTGRKVGIDLGIKTFATLSDGKVFENLRFLRENQFKMKRLQRHLSRKKKGSTRFKKMKLRIARLHEKIANTRRHYLHELSSYICNHYDVIAIEDLNVSGMFKNHKLAGAISDVSFSEFRQILTYKSDWFGKDLKVIGRFEPTSKKCSSCSWIDQELTLADRTFKCKNCGIKIDRDLNAAINILAVGVHTA